jgi:hypothetical protein
MRISENFDSEQRIIIDRILSDMWETMTEENCKEYYEYLKEKLYLHQVPKEVDYRHVLKQRLYGRVKWALITCSIARLKKMEQEKEKYIRPYFIEIMTRI